MSKIVSLDAVLIKLRKLRDSDTPVLFRFSLRPPNHSVSASGHGLIELPEGSVHVIGRAGSLRLPLNEKTEYQVSGHYAFKAGEQQDIYFQRISRARAIVAIAEHWEAYLIYECGADR